MGHCGASADDGGDSGISGAGAGDVEVADIAETNSNTESCGKVGGVDVRPPELSSEHFANRKTVAAGAKAPDKTASFMSELKLRPPKEPMLAASDSNAERWSFAAIGQWLLLALVHLYRIFLSPFLGGACKFYPSCSQYAQEAIALHGAKHGSWLALKRLGRCRPFTKGGFDPVPDSMLGYEDLGTRDTHTRTHGAEKFSAARLIAASRERHDYSDAEWLRSVDKELE